MTDFSDEMYVPDVEDSDSEELSDELTDEFNEDEREVSGGWALVSDIFSDLPEFTTDFSGLNSALIEQLFYTPSEAFKAFFDEEQVKKLCEWPNKRAAVFFSRHPKKRGKVNGIKWREETDEDMYTFFCTNLCNRDLQASNGPVLEQWLGLQGTTPLFQRGHEP